MNAQDLGMDRMVVATWAPDDTWPAFVEGLSDELTDDDELDDELDHESGVGSRATSTPMGREVGEGSALPARAPESVEAVAAIDGHPLHPVVVPLPIASFLGAFVCDLAYLRSHDRFWARSARLLTGAGIATGLAAGALGALDFTGRREIRSRPSAWIHAAGNLSVIGLGVASEVLRSRDERRAVHHGALVLSAAGAALLGVTGWLGGELAYRDRIGVARS